MACSSSNVIAVTVTNDPQTHEDAHVHEVYDQIAHHFSMTRYKPWPIVAQFLSSFPTGSVGLDSGTGNGKYLPLPLGQPGRLWTIGLDRSRNLLEIARNSGNSGVIWEVVRGDVLERGWRSGVFDYAISIATIHHLSTYDRRMKAIQRLLQCVSPTHGRILIFVWAIEQDRFSKRTIPADTQNGTDPAVGGVGQDVFVPWVLSKEHQKNQNTDHASSDISLSAVPRETQVFHRYYHLFSDGELARLVSSAAEGLGLVVGPPPEMPEKHSKTRGVAVIQEGWERSNYYIELRCWEVQ